MEGRRANNLCILCYKPTSTSNLDGKNSFKILQRLFRYLNINLKPCDNLFKGELLSCDDCFELGESFCDLLFQWENLRLQLEWRVRNLFETMRCAGRISTRVNEFRNQFVNEEDDSKIVCRDIQKLRGELLRGCKRQLKLSFPKVVLNRIPEERNRTKELRIVPFPQKIPTPLENNQIINGLMTFFAILHLSVPLHPHQQDVPKDAHLQTHRKGKKTFWGVDKQVQTCPPDQYDVLPPVLTPFDFYNDGVHKQQVVVEPIQPVSVELVPPVPNLTAKCELCDEMLDSSVLLTLHQRSIHKIKTPFECPQPNCKFGTHSTVAFRLHMRRVHKSVTGLPGDFQCDTCQERFTTALTLQRHSSVHQETSQFKIRLKCKQCSQYFETKAKLHSHTYHLHGQSQRSKKKRRKSQRSVPTSPFDCYLRNALTIKCPICHIPSKDQETLSSHMRLVHQRILAYKCVHCSTKLKTVEGFRSHMNFLHGKLIKADLKLLSRENVRYSYTGTNPPNQNEMERLSAQLGVQSSAPASPLPLLSPSGEMEVDENGLEMSPTRSSCEQPSQPTISASTSPPPQSEPEPISVEVATNAAPPLISSEAEVEEIFPTNNLSELPTPPLIVVADTPSPLLEPVRPESVESMIESLIGNITIPQAPEQQRQFFPCNFEGCGRSFSTAAYFRVHRRIHTGEKPFQCQWPGCLHKFAGRSLLKTHSRLHVITTPFHCEPCQLFLNNNRHLALHLKTMEHLEASRIVQDQNLTEQQEPQQSFGRVVVEPIPPDSESENVEQNLNHQTPIWKCFICQASFCLQSELSNHLSSEHGQQPVVKFGCKPCGVEFEASKEFVHHMYRVHGKVLQVREQEQPDHDLLKWKYVCPEVGCDVRCASQEEVINHLNSHGNVTTPNRSVLQNEAAPSSVPAMIPPLPQTSPQIHTVEERTWGFQCSHCPNQFENQTDLQIHIGIYHRQDETPLFGCP